MSGCVSLDTDFVPDFVSGVLCSWAEPTVAIAPPPSDSMVIICA